MLAATAFHGSDSNLIRQRIMFAKKVLGDSIGRNRLWGSQPRHQYLKEIGNGMHYMLAMEIAELFRFLD